MTRKSSRKGDYAQSSLYDPFMGNPVRDRKALIERMYIRILTELACNRFKWTGLPDTIDERFLELTLFRSALSVFYYDAQFGRYMALRAAGTGAINMYDNPTTFTVIGNTMVNKRLTAKECVPIWANYLRIPDWDIISIYATKLAEIDRTIEINLNSMRHSFVLTVPENQRLSYVNIMRQHDEGQPVIFGTDALDPTANINVFPVLIDKETVLNLQLSKSKLWSECMTLLGINNANQDKKERLISGEIEANNGQVVASRGIALKARKMAAEQINKRYLLSVDVSWDLDPSAAPEAPERII